MWANYHTHSKYCDGKGELNDYIQSAKKHGVTSLGFSSHAPVPFDCSWSMDKDSFAAYLQEIETLRCSNPAMEIYKGLEIDFIPGVVAPYEFKQDLDFTIGSIHFVDELPDGRRWEIDNSHAVFTEGLEKIFKNNFKDAVVRYFELTREMIFGSTIDILGHLDKIKIQNKDGKFFSEDDPWYRDEIMSILNLLDDTNLIVEVNTRGIYQKKSVTTYPSPWILEELFKRKLSVTISSDAHHPDDLVSHFPEAAKMLNKIGYKTISVMREGMWKKVPFTEDGIVQ